MKLDDNLEIVLGLNLDAWLRASQGLFEDMRDKSLVKWQIDNLNVNSFF